MHARMMRYFYFLEARTNAEFSEVVKSQQGDAGNV